MNRPPRHIWLISTFFVVAMSMEQAVKPSNTRPGMIIAVTCQEAADAVAKKSGTIAGATLVQLKTEKLPLNVLSSNAITPSLDALATGRYPLAKPLNPVSSPKSSLAALQCIQLAQSAEGRAILTASGSLPPASNKSVR